VTYVIHTRANAWQLIEYAVNVSELTRRGKAHVVVDVATGKYVSLTIYFLGNLFRFLPPPTKIILLMKHHCETQLNIPP